MLMKSGSISLLRLSADYKPSGHYFTENNPLVKEPLTPGPDKQLNLPGSIKIVVKLNR
jgi:hypothetical protein